VAVGAAICPVLSRLAQAQDMALFGQGASALLDREFANADLSWLLIDRSGQALAQHWADAGQPVSPGSLLKPFVATAFGEQHRFAYPQLQCNGTSSHCWYPQGHGLLGLEDALARSCNAYFLGLARGLDRARVFRTFAAMGLHGSQNGMQPEDLIGLTSAWREQPSALARAYLALMENATNPSHDRICAGMKSAAMNGTARNAGRAFGTQALLAKTGTAPCSHHSQAAADGFTVLLYPAANPRFVFLVRQHGVSGAHTAAQAGAMLHAIGLGAS
jgi:cell division protein FtsI/penicillin-binding protein 2